MKGFGKVVLAAAALSLAGAPVTAQSWKWDWGINGGYSWLSKALDQDQTGLTETSGANGLSLAPGLLAGTQLTFWTSPKFGLRANMRYGSRDLKGADMDGDEGRDFIENVHLWGGTIDAMIRFKAPAAEYTGSEFLPYLALGGGLKWHNPAGDRFTCIDPQESEGQSCGTFTTGLSGPSGTNTFPPAQSWALMESSTFVGHVGLGADWRMSRNFALRLEINDQIFQPRIYRTEPLDPPPATDNITLSDGDENESNWVNEIGGQIGLHFLFGVPRPPAVAVITPAPEPPVVQPPVRQPDPLPVERVSEVTVCVIDPTVPGGIRMQTAVYRETQRDTMVDVNGQRVPLRNAIGNVMVASNADWYVRGTALQMSVGSETVQFITTGTPTMVSNSDLAFLGTVNGLAIYADRDDVSDVRDELAELNRAQRGTDLGRILNEHKQLREDLEDVKVFYVPLQPTGCVFQALQLQPPVRKGKQ